MDNLVVNFIEQTLIFEYFSVADIGSQLGGLAASAKIALGSLATLVMYKFIYKLALLIKRKD